MSISSLGKTGKGGVGSGLVAHYYEEKSADYYLADKSGGDLAWLGDGARGVGLSGLASREDFRLALHGFVGEQRVQNAGNENRQMGWDVTFSAPKSVSIEWALASPAHKAEIEAAHKAAVEVAMGYLEDNATTRRGHGGMEIDKAKLIYAAVDHFTSRAGDMQIHTHTVIANVGLREDGTIGTIQSHFLYEKRLTAGALYQAELAYRMREMGKEIEPNKGGTFRLKAVPKEAEDLYSKRTNDINKIAEKLEAKTQKTINDITVSSRQRKVKTTLAERTEFWQTELKEAGLVVGVYRPTVSLILDKKVNLTEMIGTASALINDTQSTFKEYQLLKETAVASYGVASGKQIRESVTASLGGNLVKELANDVYSTPEMIKTENEMAESTKLLAFRHGYNVTPQFNGPIQLSDEQKAAVTSATGDAAISVIQGRAGTGKTTLLKAVKKSYEKAGYNVLGVTIAGQAAKVLESETGIPSRTVASWLLRQEKINSRTVMIVDETGMVGSNMTNTLLSQARDNGSKIIFVGDQSQLQPISAGSALRAVDSVLRKENVKYSSQVTTIIRQREPWMKEAVGMAAEGNIADAIDLLDKNGRISILTNPNEARRELIADFMAVPVGKKATIVTVRNADADKINSDVRQQLKDLGKIGKEEVAFRNKSGDKMALAVGDRVILGQNEYKLHDVRNGERGVVVGVTSINGGVTIKLDETDEVKRFSTDSYNSIGYGWATTTYKAQGMTVDKAFIYAQSGDNRTTAEQAYVQMSRSREETRFYVVGGAEEREPVASEEAAHIKKVPSLSDREAVIDEMKRVWSRSGEKDTTLDYQKDARMPEKTFELTR